MRFDLPGRHAGLCKDYCWVIAAGDASAPFAFADKRFLPVPGHRLVMGNTAASAGLMSHNSHRARKRFGQNFLHDAGVIHRILRAINAKPDGWANDGSADLFADRPDARRL